MLLKSKRRLALAILCCVLFSGSQSIVFADEFDDEFNRDITKEGFDDDAKPKKANKSSALNSLKTVEKEISQKQRKLESEMQNQQADFQLYLQMQKVDNWLTQYCVWNHHWPEYIEEANGVINQLAELVPNNPYQPGQLQESKGRSTDPDYRYNWQPLNQFYNGEAASGFEPGNFAPVNSYEAYGRKKIKIFYNPSLTAEQVRVWEKEPPDSWREPAGTITGISNGQNLIVVWGAGANGRPIKVPGSKKKIRIFVSNIWMQGTPAN